MVMLKHPGHLTSMKYELGPCTRRFFSVQANSGREDGDQSRRGRGLEFSRLMGIDGT